MRKRQEPSRHFGRTALEKIRAAVRLAEGQGAGDDGEVKHAASQQEINDGKSHGR
jgi:hypothetical protein